MLYNTVSFLRVVKIINALGKANVAYPENIKQKLSACFIPSGVIALAGVIPTMGAMTSLDVSNNDLWPEGAKHIAAALPACK